MLKKTITYTDYDGAERTEDFYFNLSRAEVVEMEAMDGDGGAMSSLLSKIVQEKDVRKIMENFKKIIEKSYGEKSPDGKRFIKSPEMSKAFMESEAYSELMMELIGNADAAAAFANGILPKAPEGGGKVAPFANSTK